MARTNLGRLEKSFIAEKFATLYEMIDLTQEAAIVLETSVNTVRFDAFNLGFYPYENAYMKRCKFQRAKYLIQTRLHNARLPFKADSCERD